MSCDALRPDWKPGRFAMMLKVDIVAESPELVLELGNWISKTISFDPASCASVHEIGGAILPLAGPNSRWVDQIDRKGEFLPRGTPHLHSKAELEPTGDGKLRLGVDAWLVCERQPVGRVTVTLDGEAIRNSLAAWMGSAPVRSIAVGGLVSKPAEVVVPAVTMPDPPTSGSGIGGPIGGR